MPSKQVSDRERSARTVGTALTSFAPEVQRALEERLVRYLREGEKMPDVKLLLELSARELADRSGRLAAAQQALEHELGDDGPVREARDAVQARLGGRVVELREVLTGLYGRDVLDVLGFDERTPQEPQPLIDFARAIAKALVARELPAPRIRGAVVDKAALASELEGMCQDLAKHLDEVAREEREAQEALGVRNLSQGSYDQGFSEVASLGSVLLRMAGRRDLADRVRPSQRRPGQTEEEPDEGSGGAGPG